MAKKLLLLTGVVYCSLILSIIQLVAYFAWTTHHVDGRRTEFRNPLTLHWNATGAHTQGSELRWRGTRCGSGSLLSDKKLLKYCRDPARASWPISPSYCKRILKDREPPCGFFIGGKFDAPLSVMPLAALRPLLGDEGSACASYATYSGPQSNATITVDEVDGLSGDFILRPTACPGYRYFTPVEALSVLHHASIGRDGHGILMTGDSMMRQLLLRAMFYWRGESFFAEHYFHTDGLYVVYEDRDELVIRPGCAHRALVERYFPGFPASSLRGAPCGPAGPVRERVVLIILYVWDERPRTHRMEPFAMTALPVYLASFNYWWRKEQDAAEDIRGYMDRVVDKLVRSNGSKLMRYYYATTPSTIARFHHILPEDARVFRNREVWNSLKSFSQGKNVSASLIDFAALADVRHVGRSKDLVHYMCTWMPAYTAVITMQKDNLNGCRDPVNLALFQWILHFLLAEISSS